MDRQIETQGEREREIERQRDREIEWSRLDYIRFDLDQIWV